MFETIIFVWVVLSPVASFIAGRFIQAGSK